MPQAQAEKYWIGSIPERCDICHKPIELVFIDGKTRFGPWGIMCKHCWYSYGEGLGLGRGQKYVHQTDGRFKKIES